MGVGSKPREQQLAERGPASVPEHERGSPGDSGLPSPQVARSYPVLG